MSKGEGGCQTQPGPTCDRRHERLGAPLRDTGPSKAINTLIPGAYGGRYQVPTPGSELTVLLLLLAT